MPTKRDTESLREFLVNHFVQGYRVMAPIFGESTIERQISTGGGFIFYRVVADNPVPFQTFAHGLRVDSEPMTLKRWEDRFIAGKTKSLPPMAVDLRDQLEAGGKVSPQDVLFRELLDVGCIDENQMVFCYTFDSRQLPLTDVKKGMAVQIQDQDGQMGWPGRVVSVDGPTAFIEQFAPVTFMRTPEAIRHEKIGKGFYSSQVIALGYGIVDAFGMQQIPLPPGRWTEDRQEYELEEPMPMVELEKFCKKHYAKERHCVLQGMLLFILPVVFDLRYEAQLFPLPEGQDPEMLLVELEEPF